MHTKMYEKISTMPIDQCTDIHKLQSKQILKLIKLAGTDKLVLASTEIKSCSKHIVLCNNHRLYEECSIFFFRDFLNID